MNPQLTDQAVADLPLSAGRAELLEEIMSTPVLDDTTTPAPSTEPRRATRWVAPIAAAAAVLALVSLPAWWPSGESPDRPAPAPGPAEPGPAEPMEQEGHLAVLDAEGWAVENVENDPEYGGSISYDTVDAYLEITWTPASSYADYVEDREHIVDPPAPGEPVEVLGAAGQLWAYSADDHTVIREVQDGYWMEFRAGGLSRKDFLHLLGSLTLVDRAGFEATLPPDYVTSAENADSVMEMLAEIQSVTGEMLPQGAAPVASSENDPYHIGADVAGGYACRWIDAFVAGDDRARDVLATARQWPVLQRMDERGDYPEVLWEIADEVAAGQVPEGYEGALGC